MKKHNFVTSLENVNLWTNNLMYMDRPKHVGYLKSRSSIEVYVGCLLQDRLQMGAEWRYRRE